MEQEEIDKEEAMSEQEDISQDPNSEEFVPYNRKVYNVSAGNAEPEVLRRNVITPKYSWFIKRTRKRN